MLYRISLHLNDEVEECIGVRNRRTARRCQVLMNKAKYDSHLDTLHSTWHMSLDIVIFWHNYILIYSNTEIPYIPIYTHKYQYTPIYTHIYPYIPIHTHLYPYLPINSYPCLCISMVVIWPPIIYLSTSKTIEKRGSKNVKKIKGVNWWQIHTHTYR